MKVVAKNQGISSLFEHCKSSQELIDVSNCYHQVCVLSQENIVEKASESQELHTSLYLIGYSMELAIKSKAYWVYKEYKKPREKINESIINKVLDLVIFEEGVTRAIEKKHETNCKQYPKGSQEYNKSIKAQVEKDIKEDIHEIAKKIIKIETDSLGRNKSKNPEKPPIPKFCSLEGLLKHIQEYTPHERKNTNYDKDVTRQVTKGMLESAMTKLKNTNFSTQGDRHNIAKLWESLGKLLKVWNEPHQQEMENQILHRNKGNEEPISARSLEKKADKDYPDQTQGSSLESTKPQNKQNKESGWESLANKIQSLSWNEQVRYKTMTRSKQDAKKELSKAISLSKELLEACTIAKSK